MNTQAILNELGSMLFDGGTLSNSEILDRMEQLLTAHEVHEGGKYETTCEVLFEFIEDVPLAPMVGYTIEDFMNGWLKEKCTLPTPPKEGEK